MQAILLVTVFSCLLAAEGAIDDACTASSTCTPDTTICDNSKCKTKAELTCSAVDECVSHATCTGTPKKCTCGDGYTASSDFCKVKAGGTCAATSECVAQSTCVSTKCTCNDGYSAAATGLCSSNKGVALGQVSVWTLCMTILTVSLAVNVV